VGPKPVEPILRFLRHVVHADNGCWIWVGARGNYGHGLFSDRVQGRVRPIGAHVFSLEYFSGKPVPRGMHVHHVCSTPSCVHPLHLVCMTAYEHTMQPGHVARVRSEKTHCPRGHPYSGANLEYRQRSRKCIACRRIKANARYRRSRIRAMGL